MGNEESTAKKTTFNKMDYGLYKYYCTMNSEYINHRDLYFNINNVGKVEQAAFEFSGEDYGGDPVEEDEIGDKLREIAYVIGKHPGIYQMKVEGVEAVPQSGYLLQRDKDHYTNAIEEILQNILENEYHYCGDDDVTDLDNVNDDIFAIECESIDSCSSLLYVVSALKYYNLNDITLISKFFNSKTADYNDNYDNYDKYEEKQSNNSPLLTEEKQSDIAIYQSVVYGNNQLLLKKETEKNINIKNILNAYHHILEYHLGDQKNTKAETVKNFKFISDTINKHVQCDIHKCSPYSRNNRNRDTANAKIENIDSDNSEAIFLVDLLDTIHTSFVHSYDTGFRFDFGDIEIPKHDEKAAEDEDIDFVDHELIKISQFIKKKKDELFKARQGIEQNQTNKFTTTIDDHDDDEESIFLDDITDRLTENEIENNVLNSWTNFVHLNEYDTESIKFDLAEEDPVTESNVYTFWEKINELAYYKLIRSFTNKTHQQHGQYSFGVNFSYWPGGEGCYVEPKYESLKSEILANGVQFDDFTDIIFKSQTFLDESHTLKKMKSTYDGRRCANFACGFILYSPIQIHHISALLFYTNFTELSYLFSSSFRAIKSKDTVESIAKRNSSFATMARFLKELVNCFGNTQYDTNPKNGIFYHGVSYLYFNKFSTAFLQPTSTTKHMEVAQLFAKEDGLILELSRAASYNYVRSFDCSLVSAFNSEDERLFFGMDTFWHHYLDFKTIHLVKEKQNLSKFIIILKAFQKKKIEKQKHVKILKKLIDSLSMSVAEKPLHPYIHKIFELYGESLRRIYFDFYYDKYNSLFKPDSIHGCDFPKISIVANVFPNVTEIECGLYIRDVNKHKNMEVDELFITSLINEVKTIRKQNKLRKLKVLIHAARGVLSIKSGLDIYSTFQSINCNIVYEEQVLNWTAWAGECGVPHDKINGFLTLSIL
eukprot:432422_1